MPKVTRLTVPDPPADKVIINEYNRARIFVRTSIYCPHAVLDEALHLWIQILFNIF